MSNMRLNNAVEEALGQGDGLEVRPSFSELVAMAGGPGTYPSNTLPSFADIAHGVFTDAGTRLSALRINHAEDEVYGMRHHES